MSNLDDYYKKYGHSKPKTIADYIRTMTDEELADYLRYHSDSYARYDMDWLDWLKQEYTTFVAQEYEKNLNDRLNREGIAP